MKITSPRVMFSAPALLAAFIFSACTRDAKKDRALESSVKHFEAHDYPAAEIELKNALAANPGNPKAVKLLGIIRGAQGANYEAARILTQVKTKLPADDEVGVHLA